MMSDSHLRSVLNKVKDKTWRFGEPRVDRNEKTNLFNAMQGEIIPSLFIKYTRLYTKKFAIKQMAIVMMGINLDSDEDIEAIRQFISKLKKVNN